MPIDITHKASGVRHSKTRPVPHNQEKILKNTQVEDKMPLGQHATGKIATRTKCRKRVED